MKDDARVPVTDDALAEKVARAIWDGMLATAPNPLIYPIWESKPESDRDLCRVAARAAIAIAYPAGVAAGREEAWRDGFGFARQCLTYDEAFCLTEDIEQDAWVDSKTAAAIRQMGGE